MLEEIQRGAIPMRKSIKVKFKPDSPGLIFSSMFDSGNLQKLQLISNNYIAITPANDCSGTSIQSLSKGWFYFSVSGATTSTKLKLIIKKMNQLNSQTKISEYFKPVYKYEKQQWKRVQNARTITKQDDTQLHIQFQITKNSTVYFAYTYPFSYQDCQNFLRKIQKQAKKIKSIQYSDQILIKSPENRNIHFLTLTSNENNQSKQEVIENQYIFPEKTNQNKNLKIFSEKKVIFISARVHPAQAPSSHTFNGLLKFLLSKDARAYFLRKYFVFILIPMLNPDGVSNGHYRMDIFNQNLNRFYQNPDPSIQPSAYAVKKLGQFYHSHNKLCFYMDLHAHPQRKGNFIYGNAFQNVQSQIQTQLFAKILSLNCIQFDYENSSFDQKHMTLKDKNQNLTKQGCGRVVFQKQFQQIYSYTMECGYTCSNVLNQIVSIDKGNRKFQKHGIINQEIQNIKSPFYGGGKKNILFMIETYEALGKAVCVSILDLFSLNPASRLPNTSYKNLQGIRKDLSFTIGKNSNPNNFRIYYLKPNSQQGKKQNNQINTSKTICSVDNIKVKRSINSIQKKKIVVSSQLVFFPLKNTVSKNGLEIKSQNQISQQKVRIKNATLPKVNLFKLNNIQHNLSKLKRGK